MAQEGDIMAHLGSCEANLADVRNMMTHLGSCGANLGSGEGHDRSSWLM